jgi:hypothetical protein
MAVSFTSKDHRDALAKKLVEYHRAMLSAFDQGHNGAIGVTHEMAEDILCAAAVVGTADVRGLDCHEQLERVSRLERLVIDLCTALRRQDTDLDGNWGNPSSRAEYKRIGAELANKPEAS